MSSIKLSPNASGTGEFTIAAPNSNTNRTLNLPDNTGTIVTTGSTAVVTQSMLASGVAGNGPTFSAIAGSVTSLGAGANTKVNFTTEQWDTANCYDTSTSRFTPNVAGYYQISSTVRADIVGNNVLHIYVRKNGVDTVVGDFLSVSSNQAATTVSGLIFCNGTTDFVEISVFSGAAGSTAATFQTSFQGVLVRTA